VQVAEFFKNLWRKISEKIWGVVEQQREIVSEAVEADTKLEVRRDRVNPDNYTSFTVHGVLICMRKVELPMWNSLDRHERRRLAQQYKTKINKGELVYKEYDGVTLLVSKKQVLDPNFHP
jgi:hypothetical protein